MECSHLEKVCNSGSVNFPSLQDKLTPFQCGECGDTGSVWICVTCGSLNCGRYVNEHGLKHKEKTKTHTVCMETKELSVFCYECDEFVVNDTPDRVLESIRTRVLTKNLAQQEKSESSIESPANRSLRARRKRPISQSPIGAHNKSSKKENKHKGERKSRKTRVGLKNLGNTCFMNSVLQSLSNIEQFCNVLTTLPSLNNQVQKSNDVKKKVARTISNDGIILTDELKKVLVALKQEEENTAISPESLFQAIWKVVPRFRGYQQQDAHEFLRYMLDRLHTELLSLLPPTDTELLTKKPKLGLSTQSLVTSIFGGSLQSCVTCLNCKQTSKKQDPFLDLSIDIPQIYTGPVRKTKDGDKLSPCHIHDCLQKFVEREDLAESEHFFCNSCKSKQPSTKQLYIQRLPRVLCLHIKRFRWSVYARSKLDTLIEFPLNDLDMSGYLLKNTSGTRFSDAGSPLYDLAAVIVHHGTGAGSGHYTAYATNNQAWFNFNDSSVQETDHQTVHSSKAYILFYIQRDF